LGPNRHQVGSGFFEKLIFNQSDKLGVILASIWLIDAAANCRHGAQIIVLMSLCHCPLVGGPDG
jgi:hypothetical protein